jgi:hypothetical protein
MTILATVQRFCRRTNITVPGTVLGSTDPQILQVLALLEEEGNDLSGRGSWQAITLEATHTTVATESQGDINTIASGNFRYVKNNTIWDRTENLPVIVIDGPDWQAEKGFASTSPRYRARIRGNNLIVTPTPVAGNTWAFEYVSWNWILDTNGTTRKQYFTADTDTVLLPEPIIQMGLRWRWKKEKGFEYAEDFRTYEMMVADAFSRDGIRRNLNMGSKPEMGSPKIVVNQGNWPL